MKIVLIGDSKTGKTTWVKNLLGVTHDNQKTLGVDVFRYESNGIHYYIWDTAGDPNVGGLRCGYFINADAIIIMGNNKDKYYKEVEEMIEQKFCRDNVPIYEDDFQIN